MVRLWVFSADNVVALALSNIADRTRKLIGNSLTSVSVKMKTNIDEVEENHQHLRQLG